MTNRSDTPAILQARASAKINLTLGVFGVRADGYHEIESIAIGVGLHDTVRCALSDGTGVAITCSDSTIQSSSNLAYLAATRLSKHVNSPSGVNIELQKRIPVGGGMGGGSSDAATTLQLCNQLWDGGMDQAQLAEIGASIGSDVPLFFSLPTAKVSGRGELVDSATLGWSGWALLVFGGQVVPTSAVYAAFREADHASRGRDVNSAVMNASTAETLSTMLYNDLESAVLRVAPDIGHVQQALDMMGMGNWRISGAGSTLFLLFDEQQTAVDAAQRVAQLTGKQTAVVAAPVDTGHMST